MDKVIKLADLTTATGKVHQNTRIYDGGVSHAHSERKVVKIHRRC